MKYKNKHERTNVHDVKMKYKNKHQRINVHEVKMKYKINTREQMSMM